MELLDSLTIPNKDDSRSLELWQGNLTELTPAEAVQHRVAAQGKRDNTVADEWWY